MKGTRTTTALAVFATMLWPAVLAGQNADDASVSIQVAEGISVTKTIDMDFGSHPSGAVVHSSAVGAVAQWDVALAALGDYNFSFSLPTALTGPGGSVPITFGYAVVADQSMVGYLIDPNFGATVPYVGNGPLIVQMGGDYDATGNDVAVNLAGAAGGVYSGVVTLTVAVP